MTVLDRQPVAAKNIDRRSFLLPQPACHRNTDRAGPIRGHSSGRLGERVSAGDDHAGRNRWPSRPGRVAQAARARALSRSSSGFMEGSRRCRWRVSRPRHATSPPARGFLAAGYVFVAPTYRSRDVDLQTTDSVEDALAVVEYLRKLPFVDRQSIVVGGCSGGGDLALQVAARTSVCAVVAEEPASVLMSGIFNNSVQSEANDTHPKTGSF